MLRIPIKRLNDLIKVIESNTCGDFFGLMSLSWSPKHGINTYVNQLKRGTRDYLIIVYLIDMVGIKLIGKPHIEISTNQLHDVWVNKTVNLNFLDYIKQIPLYIFLPLGNSPYSTYIKKLFKVIQTLPTMYTINKEPKLDEVINSYPTYPI